MGARGSVMEQNAVNCIIYNRYVLNRIIAFSKIFMSQLIFIGCLVPMQIYQN